MYTSALWQLCWGVFFVVILGKVDFFDDLEVLQCDNSQLTSLDVSKNSKLEYLKCENNKLTNISMATILNPLYIFYLRLLFIFVSMLLMLQKFHYSRRAPHDKHPRPRYQR